MQDIISKINEYSKYDMQDLIFKIQYEVYYIYATYKTQEWKLEMQYVRHNIQDTICNMNIENMIYKI